MYIIGIKNKEHFAIDVFGLLKGAQPFKVHVFKIDSTESLFLLSTDADSEF